MPDGEQQPEEEGTQQIDIPPPDKIPETEAQPRAAVLNADGKAWLREAEASIVQAVLGGEAGGGDGGWGWCRGTGRLGIQGRRGVPRPELYLGEQYEALRADDRLPEAIRDVQNARTDERLRMLEESRRTELEERLRLFAREETVLHAEQHRLARAAQGMRRRARQQLSKEVDAARWLEQQKFDADKKFIIDHEREKLVRRRRAYEARVQATTMPSHQHGSPERLTDGSPSGSPQRGYTDPAADVAPPLGTQGENNVVLVMTVDIGEGREDVITVRERDDYQQLARRFIAQHRLPEQVAEPLAREIARNVRNPPPPGSESSPAAVASLSQRGDDGAFQPSLGPTTQRLSQQRAQEPVFDRLYPDSRRPVRKP